MADTYEKKVRDVVIDETVLDAAQGAGVVNAKNWALGFRKQGGLNRLNYGRIFEGYNSADPATADVTWRISVISNANTDAIRVRQFAADGSLPGSDRVFADFRLTDADCWGILEKIGGNLILTTGKGVEVEPLGLETSRMGYTVVAGIGLNMNGPLYVEPVEGRLTINQKRDLIARLAKRNPYRMNTLWNEASEKPSDAAGIADWDDMMADLPSFPIDFAGDPHSLHWMRRPSLSLIAAGESCGAYGGRIWGRALENLIHAFIASGGSPDIYKRIVDLTEAANKMPEGADSDPLTADEIGANEVPALSGHDPQVQRSGSWRETARAERAYIGVARNYGFTLPDATTRNVVLEGTRPGGGLQDSSIFAMNFQEQSQMHLYYALSGYVVRLNAPLFHTNDPLMQPGNEAAKQAEIDRRLAIADRAHIFAVDMGGAGQDYYTAENDTLALSMSNPNTTAGDSHFQALNGAGLILTARGQFLIDGTPVESNPLFIRGVSCLDDLLNDPKGNQQNEILSERYNTRVRYHPELDEVNGGRVRFLEDTSTASIDDNLDASIYQSRRYGTTYEFETEGGKPALVFNQITLANKRDSSGVLRANHDYTSFPQHRHYIGALIRALKWVHHVHPEVVPLETIRRIQRGMEAGFLHPSYTDAGLVANNSTGNDDLIDSGWASDEGRFGRDAQGKAIWVGGHKYTDGTQDLNVETQSSSMNAVPYTEEGDETVLDLMKAERATNKRDGDVSRFILERRKFLHGALCEGAAAIERI